MKEKNMEGIPVFEMIGSMDNTEVTEQVFMMI